MCGRFVQSRATSDPLPDLLAEFPDLAPSYNVAPTQKVPVVRQRDDKRSLEQPQWGFAPSWAKDFAKARPRPINARIETVATSGLFRSAFAKHRVLVPASCYIEWTITETGKQPHYIYDPDAGLALAGILSFWPDPKKSEDDPDKWRETVAIITRDSHVAPGEVHDRTPALISPAGYDDWLGNHLDGDDLKHMLQRESHAAAGNLTPYEVSRDINNVRNNNEQLILPLPGQ